MSDIKNKDNTAIDITRRYAQAKVKEEPRRTVRERCFSYVNNWVDGKLGQWTTDTLGKLGNKPALSFNAIKKFVNRICGVQAQNKLDEKAYPRDDQSDWVMAEILTDLLKFVKDNTNGELAIKRGFRDGVIGDSGYVKVEWSDEFDPLGEIVVKSVSPNRVYVLGSPELLDMSDGAEIIEEIPMSWE